MANQQEVAKTDSSTESKIVPSNSPFQRSYWCQTKAELIRINFDWTIERLAFLAGSEIEECFTSTGFGGKFNLCFHLKKNCVQIKLLSSTIFQYPTRVDIAIMKEKSEKIEQQTIYTPANSVSNIRVPLIVFDSSKTTKLENFGKGDITISCKIESINRKQPTEAYLDETAISEADRFRRQLEEVFENMPLSDVTFNIRCRKFAAHKIVLAMRSPVFKAMFHHPTKEVLSSQVNVEDIDPDVFQEVLRFIYTGQTQSTAMDKMAPGLLAAADKYLLEDLKTRCENHLIRQMSADNCLELLSLTTHHPAEHLKKYAIEYFRCYPENVMKTDNWTKMKKENPAALCDLQQTVFSITSPTV
jgi:speckle-type POZ protein